MLDRRALVRRPSPRLSEGLLTHLERSPVDLDLALAQWHDYVAALQRSGWETIEVPPADDCPDSVFVEDTVVMYGDRAVIARPGAESRRGETAAVATVLHDLGYDVVQISEPATLDGGDVLKHDGVVWVGQAPTDKGGRTNAQGLHQLAALLPHARVIGVPITKVLHLKSAVTALPDGTVIGYSPVVDDPAVWSAYAEVPEEPGAHVVLLGPDTEGREQVLLSSAAPLTATLLTQRGLRVISVDISEFEKLEGCVTCLSVRLRRTP